MTITHEDELEAMKAIGRIVANTLQAMSRAIEPGMTTRELDKIGRDLLDKAGAVSAPQSSYGFPGATCISVNEEIAHGVPGERVIAPGDLVNLAALALKAHTEWLARTRPGPRSSWPSNAGKSTCGRRRSRLS